MPNKHTGFARSTILREASQRAEDELRQNWRLLEIRQRISAGAEGIPVPGNNVDMEDTEGATRTSTNSSRNVQTLKKRRVTFSEMRMSKSRTDKK